MSVDGGGELTIFAVAIYPSFALLRLENQGSARMPCPGNWRETNPHAPPEGTGEVQPKVVDQFAVPAKRRRNQVQRI